MNKYNKKITCVKCDNKYDIKLDECPLCNTSKETHEEKEIDKILKALDNANRRKVLKFLIEKPASRREIADLLNVALEAVVRHCDLLLDVNVIREESAKNEERGGYITKYSINIDRLKEVLKKLNKHITITPFTNINETMNNALETFSKETSEDLESKSWLVVDSGDNDGKSIPIEKFPVILGRDRSPDINLPFDNYISNPNTEISFDKEKDNTF